jgi:hypothetical protein
LKNVLFGVSVYTDGKVFFSGTIGFVLSRDLYEIKSLDLSLFIGAFFFGFAVV